MFSSRDLIAFGVAERIAGLEGKREAKTTSHGHHQPHKLIVTYVSESVSSLELKQVLITWKEVEDIAEECLDTRKI
ncbi:hypothetical protein Tco_1250925 [Tanacetum coccineum]